MTPDPRISNAPTPEEQAVHDAALRALVVALWDQVVEAPDVRA